MYIHDFIQHVLVRARVDRLEYNMYVCVHRITSTSGKHERHQTLPGPNYSTLQKIRTERNKNNE